MIQISILVLCERSSSSSSNGHKRRARHICWAQKMPLAIVYFCACTLIRSKTTRHFPLGFVDMEKEYQNKICNSNRKKTNTERESETKTIFAICVRTVSWFFETWTVAFTCIYTRFIHNEFGETLALTFKPHFFHCVLIVYKFEVVWQ